jgi:hypothetical protein
MKIYKDLFTNDELLSDAYLGEVSFDEAVLEVNATRIPVGGGDVDIGRGNAFGGSHEEEEAVDPNVEMVIDLVSIFNYTEVPFTKKQFIGALKGYMGKLKKWITENKPERVEAFMRGANALAQHIMGHFDEYQFWVSSESLDNPSMVILSYYKEGLTTPTFLYFKDGLREEKV